MFLYSCVFRSPVANIWTIARDYADLESLSCKFYSKIYDFTSPGQWLNFHYQF